MTGLLGRIAREERGAAAAEMAMLSPILMLLLFGSVELGNYFYNQHTLLTQVRNGARFASRLPLVTSYTCSGTPTVLTAAETSVVNVTKTGVVDAVSTTQKKMPFNASDTPCGTATKSVAVTVRCVDKDTYPGLWRGYDGDIPIVKVAGDVDYRPLFGLIGFDSSSLCLRAESELPAIGL